MKFKAKAQMVEGSIENIIFEKPSDQNAYESTLQKVFEASEANQQFNRAQRDAGLPGRKKTAAVGLKDDYMSEKIVDFGNYNMVNNQNPHMRGTVTVEIEIF